MKGTLARKQSTAAMLLLLIALILCFLPISYTSAYHYSSGTSYISNCNLAKLQDPLNCFYLVALLCSIVFHLLFISGKEKLQRMIFWPTLVSSLLFSALCIKILSVHTYSHTGEYLHDQDGMWGIVLIAGLLIASCVLSAIIQFKKDSR